ncbi:MAG: hypothetical protein LBT75_02720, partial [Bacilli bacterium]|nr:hypothetical protein [Bacilli bacterium]
MLTFFLKNYIIYWHHEIKKLIKQCSNDLSKLNKTVNSKDKKLAREKTKNEATQVARYKHEEFD